MVQYNKMYVIRDKQVCNQKFVRRPIITQTVAANKTYVLCDGIAYRTTTYIHTLIRTWFHNQIKHRITQVATAHMTFSHTKVNYYMHNYIGGYYTHDISTHKSELYITCIIKQDKLSSDHHLHLVTLAATALLVDRSGLVDLGNEALPHVNVLPMHQQHVYTLLTTNLR